MQVESISKKLQSKNQGLLESIRLNKIFSLKTQTIALGLLNISLFYSSIT